MSSFARTGLARASGSNKSSITPALRDLLRREPVARSSVARDKRVYTLRLTPKGRNLLRRLTRAAEQHDRLLEVSTGPDNRETFVCLLQQVSNAAQRYLDGREDGVAGAQHGS